MATVKKLSEDVATLRRELAELRGEPKPPAANPDAAPGAAPAAPAPNPRHVPRRNEPPAPTLTAKDIHALHAAFELTDDPQIGKLLDRVCDDPDCGASDE